MRYLFAVVILMLLSSCVTQTKYGRCIGIDRYNEDTTKVYRVSKQNVIVGSIFFETFFVPYFVVVDQMYCPVADKPKTSGD